MVEKRVNSHSSFKLAGQQLDFANFEHSEEVMHAILLRSSDAILLIDREGTIRLANPAAGEIFGLDYHQLSGLRLEEIVPAAKAPDFDRICRIAAGETDFESVGRRQNGQQFPIDFALTKLQLDKENLYTAIIRDITDRTKMRQQLEEKIAELETTNSHLAVARDKAQKASELKSMFVANISHEIRTPMSGVLGMSELLLMSELAVEDHEMAMHIYECSKNLLCIVNDILDFSKLDAGKVRLERLHFSVQSLLDQVSQTIAPAAAQKNLLITTDIASDVPTHFYGDDGRIRQTLLNLAHNAVKFTAKGKVEIGVVLEQLNEKNALIKFLVKDSGIGISKAVADTLFTPFMQADNSMTRKYGGTGLGLSICKSLVTLMSGKIAVDSVEGSGSTFWLVLPLELAPAA